MRGEEVSREIPFIFSRAFADTRPGSAWGEREKGFVCSWKRGGSREAPAGTDAGSKLEEPHGVDGVEMGWPGHSGDPQDGRWAIRFGPRPLVQLSGSLGPATGERSGAKGHPHTPQCP